MFSRLFIWPSVTLQNILYLLNCKNRLSQNLYCTGHQIDTKVINISAALWRRENDEDRHFSTSICLHFSLEITVVDMNRVCPTVKKWGSLRVDRTLQDFGILTTYCVFILKSSGLQPDVIMVQWWQQQGKGLSLTSPWGKWCSWKRQHGNTGPLH